MKCIQLLVHSSVIRSDYLSGGILTVICRTQQCEGVVTNRSFLLTIGTRIYVVCLSPENTCPVLLAEFTIASLATLFKRILN